MKCNIRVQHEINGFRSTIVVDITTGDAFRSGNEIRPYYSGGVSTGAV